MIYMNNDVESQRKEEHNVKVQSSSSTAIFLHCFFAVHWVMVDMCSI